MSNAVYFVSSLPMIQFKDAPPMSVEEFKRQCETNLNDFELGAIEALLDGKDYPEPFVSAFYSHETQLKNIAARARATEWDSDIRIMDRPFDGYNVAYAKMVNDALVKANPLEMEEALEEARFYLADELSGVGSFTMAHVYAYALKLKILERLSKLNQEAGNTALLKIINENDLAIERE
ncbi:MAG: DUF2764 family protein [Fibrobacter sp.]|jgi:hypothetical protein|nr:DUF2764 family protein [Fibrobacter sp.]